MVTRSDLLILDLQSREETRPAAIDYLAEPLEYPADEARELTPAFGGHLAGRMVADVMTGDLVPLDVGAPVRDAA